MSNEFQLSFKKLTKKDLVTRCKGLSELEVSSLPLETALSETTSSRPPLVTRFWGIEFFSLGASEEEHPRLF
jgi:hypothetical protein